MLPRVQRKRTIRRKYILTGAVSVTTQNKVKALMSTKSVPAFRSEMALLYGHGKLNKGVMSHLFEVLNADIYDISIYRKRSLLKIATDYNSLV